MLNVSRECYHRKDIIKTLFSDGPKKAAEVEKKTLTQGITEKQLRNTREYAGEEFTPG